MLHAPTSTHQHHMTLADARGHRRTAATAVSSPGHLHHTMGTPTIPMVRNHASIPAFYATVPVHHVPARQPLSSSWTAQPAPMLYAMDAHPAHTAHRRRMSVGAGTSQPHHPTHIASEHIPFPIDHTPHSGYQQLVRSPVVPGSASFAPQHRMLFVPSPTMIVATPRGMPHVPAQAHSQHRMRRNSMPVGSTKPPVIKRTRFAEEVEVHWLDVEEFGRIDGSREGPAKLRKARHDAAADGA